MKFLTAIALLAISLPAFSAANKEVVNTSVNIEEFSIRCVTPIWNGGETSFTEITGDGVMGPGIWKNSELDHSHFRSKSGCDMDTLIEILEPARSHFGFITALAKVTKITKESRWVHTGSTSPEFPKWRCEQNFSEKIELDLGKGVVLFSTARKTRDATDCKPRR